MKIPTQTDLSTKGTCVEDTPANDTSVKDTPNQNTPVENLHVSNPHVFGNQIFGVRAIRNRQRHLLWGIGTFLIGGMIVYGWIAMRETTFNNKQEFKSSLLTGSSRINPQEAWVYQFSTEAEITKKRLTAMEDMLAKILKIHTSKTDVTKAGMSETRVSGTRVSEPNDSRQSSQDNSPSRISNDPTELIESVREDLKTEQTFDGPKSSLENSVVTKKATHSANSVLPPPPGSSSSEKPSAAMPGDDSAMNIQGSMHSSPPFRSKAVRKISLSLRNARSNMPLKTVDNTIPAGAFAKAILLGGVDASASIQASSDPRPALLRIMDPGTLPRKFHSDLMGCHVLAACYGDISSERVFMRLEKLTCTERKTGEIVEVKVQGYVAGEDGRTGVRGSVVDRAGGSMRNVLMGGFLGGVGEFLSQSRSAVTFSPIAGLAQSNPMGMGDMLKHGAGKGLNNALEKYADFYIKRAEQLQPIIQVAAGRQVDIVFTEGISMGESLYRQDLGRSHDQGRYHQIQTMTEDTRSQDTVNDWVKGGELINRDQPFK